MPGRVLDGRAAAQRLEDRILQRVRELNAKGHALRLDAILVGDDPASDLYVRRKHDACRRVGIDTRLHRLAAASTTRDVTHLIDRLNDDPTVTGILLQLPLPPACDKDLLLERIRPEKDVDAFHPTNYGRATMGLGGLIPATPKGILRLLDDAQVPLRGAHVVIVNHSNLIGRPLAALLLQRDATVTVCHKHTRDLAAITRAADVLVTATGVPGLITRDHVKPGAVVIDAGIHRDGKKVRGDVVHDEVAMVASAITPVPGGVGPMTIVSLLDNLLVAHDLQRAATREAPA